MRYYLIFKKQGGGVGTFAFIIDNKEIAEDFCEHNDSYYYMSNKEWEDMRDDESDYFNPMGAFNMRANVGIAKTILTKPTKYYIVVNDECYIRIKRYQYYEMKKYIDEEKARNGYKDDNDWGHRRRVRED